MTKPPCFHSYRLPVGSTLLSFCLMLTSPLVAGILTGPVINPGTGHTYYLLTQNTWTAAEAEAVALGGQLVTINDTAEND